MVVMYMEMRLPTGVSELGRQERPSLPFAELARKKELRSL